MQTALPASADAPGTLGEPPTAAVVPYTSVWPAQTETTQDLEMLLDVAKVSPVMLYDEQAVAAAAEALGLVKRMDMEATTRVGSELHMRGAGGVLSIIHARTWTERGMNYAS